MRFEVSKVKIVVMVPCDYLEKVRMAVLDAGAGVIGNYTHCSTSFSGIGTFKPNKEATPFIGESNSFEMVPEERLEVMVQVSDVKKILSVIREVHPYEEPGIDIIPLLDEKDFLVNKKAID